MEVAEDTYVEAAILWLAQTILASLLAGKLEAWLRQVGLADYTEKLRYEIERVETVVAAGKGRAIGNKLLARSLDCLKELMYDAEDVVDELDYCRLKHHVEGDPTACANEPESTYGHGAEQADGSRYNPDTMSSSGVKKRSKVWKEFRVTEEADGKPVKAECIHCHTVVRCETTKGTSVLHNHLKSENCKRKRATPNPSAGDGAQNGATVSIHDSDSRKRKRIDEASAHNTAANKNPWNKAEFCNRIEQTTNQLKEAISEVQKLYGSDSVASTNVCKNTAADPRRRTSSLVQRKMYGRLAEKDSIMKLMTEDKSDSVLVLPIVGIGGIGKTALAQHIYNDPTVKSQFDHRIWAWVSNNVDEVRLTREMLDFVSKEKHEGISSLAKLQEILESHVTSNRFLLILDDVWGNMDEHTWNKLLAPLKSDNKKGNVIIVTTRQISIAKRIGTVEPIKLDALQDDDFWLLFRACAFGDDKYEGHPSLNIIGRQIAEKLPGNPLAAETAGMLLREHLIIDHWSNILKNENWKSLKLNGGIMPALKLSYDYLPDHLQHCFRYCCLFPKDHHFGGAELVRIWISQGFVDGSRTSKSLEDTGNGYLADLVDSGFFQKIGRDWFVMHDLMHDLAWQVSRAELGTIDGCDREEILPTVRHLSIVTDSAFSHEKIEEKSLQVESVRKLRSLVLIGYYDPSFFRYFQNMFKQAENLRLLQISATYADFVSFLSSLVNCSHLRYLKLENEFIGEDILPISLSKFYHLEVLDAGRPTIVHGMNDLVSMRYLVVTKRAYSSVTSVGEMSNHQDVLNITDQNSSCSEITQLQSMSKLVQLGVFQLENVSSAEAYGPKLRDKQHLQKLHLSWKDILSQDGYDSRSSGQFVDTAKEVLEGLEPHRNLKHLQISGYSGATSPAWLGTSVSCLQTLHLEDCGEWQILPSLGRLSFLTKLKLRKMQKVTELSIPSLEELVLIEMPQLERCSCNFVRDFNSALRILKIQRCRVLKAFPLFESCKEHKIEKKSWLSHLSELTIHDCPRLTISLEKLDIDGCNSLTALGGKLQIWNNQSLKYLQLDSCTALEELDISVCISLTALEGLQSRLKKIRMWGNQSLKCLQLDSCTALEELKIGGCDSLTALEGLQSRLKKLQIWDNQSLKCPQLDSCTALEELDINKCNSLTALEGLQSRLKKLQICDNQSLTCLQLDYCTALEELDIGHCNSLTALEGLQSLGGLRYLKLSACPGLPPYLEHLSRQGYELCPRLETLQIDDYSFLTKSFCKHLTSLQRLEVNNLCSQVTKLTDEQESALRLLTSLQELDFWSCRSLADLPMGLHSLPSLKRLKIFNCGSISRLPQMGLPPTLEELDVSWCSDELSEQCRKLETSKLKVKIDS